MQDVNTLTFGVEIEAYGMYREDVATALRAAGLQCTVQNYNHTTSTGWKVVTDASLRHRNSFELVSPILVGDDGIEQLRKAMTAIEAGGAKVGKDCGLHVHIGAGHFSLKQMKNFVKNYVYFETFFDGVMPKSRRGNVNTYCQSNRASLARASFDYASAELTAAATIKRAFETIDTATSISNLIQIAQRGSRFYKLNLMAYERHQTIEFRQHGGTVSAEKAVSWVKLVRTFVARAADSKIRTRKETTKVSRNKEFGAFFQTFPCCPVTRAFFVARRKHFDRLANVPPQQARRDQIPHVQPRIS